MTKFYTLYNKPPQIDLRFEKPTLTKQAPANEVDINTIMDRYERNGELPQPRPAVYGDALAVGDFETAMNIVNAGREAFEALPAKLRDRFANDPARFLAFVNDEANYDEALSLGLVEPRPVQNVETAATPAVETEAKPDA